MRARALFVLSAIFVLCVAALPAAADDWNKTWPVTGTAQLWVKADDGNIRVESGSSSEIVARVKTAGWRIAEDEVRVIERQTGGRVELEVKVPSRHFDFNFRREISIELTVPRNAEINLHTGDGNIATRGTEGPLRSDTGDGNITAAGARGTIELRTGDGNIEAEGLDGSLSAETGDGNLDLAGRFDAVVARTGDGNVEVTADRGSRVGSAWNVRTGDGNVTVYLPEGVAAEVDAHTGDGKVSSDFAVTVSGRVQENTLRGPMNGGGQPLELHTGDGNIRLAKR